MAHLTMAPTTPSSARTTTAAESIHTGSAPMSESSQLTEGTAWAGMVWEDSVWEACTTTTEGWDSEDTIVIVDAIWKFIFMRYSIEANKITRLFQYIVRSVIERAIDLDRLLSTDLMRCPTLQVSLH